MSYRYQLTNKNIYGDNGWWMKTGDTLAHYFHFKLPLCGTNKFNRADIGVQPKTCYDARCKNCTKVRRNQLRARMNKQYDGYRKELYTRLVKKSHSPRKPR